MGSEAADYLKQHSQVELFPSVWLDVLTPRPVMRHWHLLQQQILSALSLGLNVKQILPTTP